MTARHAIVMAPDGVTVVDFPEDLLDVAHVLRRLIGCQMLELVRLNDTLDLWIDEEGKFPADAVVNRPASAMAHICHAISADDVIVGTAVLVTRDGPETIGLTTEQVAAIIGAGANA